MKQDCPYCLTAIEGRVAMAGAVHRIDGVVVKVQPTVHFWCEDCGDGFYVQK